MNATDGAAFGIKLRTPMQLKSHYNFGRPSEVHEMPCCARQWMEPNFAVAQW
jgi:hypothetical protein